MELTHLGQGTWRWKGHTAWVLGSVYVLSLSLSPISLPDDGVCGQWDWNSS